MHPRGLVRMFSFQMPAQTPLPTLLATRDLTSTPGHCSLGAVLFTKHVNWGSLGASMEQINHTEALRTKEMQFTRGT